MYGFLKNLRFYEAFFILFLLEKGIDYAKIGILYSLREITVAILEVPSGLIADMLGRKKTLIASFIFYMLSFLLFYFSSHFGLMILAMLFFSFGDAFRSGVHKAMIFQYLEMHDRSGQKTAYYGHTRSWSQMGSAISALIAGVLVFFTGKYSIIFAASVIPYLLDMILIASYPSYLDGKTKDKSEISLKMKFQAVFSAFKKSFKSWTLFRSLSSVSVYTGYYKVIKDYIQPLIMTLALSVPFLNNVSNKQKTAVMVGVIYFLIYLATSYTSRHSGRFKNRFSDYHDPLNITLIFGLIAGGLSGVFYHFQMSTVAVILFVFILIIENLRKPIGVSFIADQSQERAMATVLSVQSQAQSLFGALIALVLGFCIQYTGVGMGLAITTVFLLFLFPVFMLKRNKQDG
jgi:MFS family permease